MTATLPHTIIPGSLASWVQENDEANRDAINALTATPSNIVVPRAKISRAAAFAYGPGATGGIPLGTLDYASGVDTATVDTIKILTAGTYMAVLNGQITNSGGIQITVNGVIVAGGHAINLRNSVSWVGALAINDLVAASFLNDDGAFASGGNTLTLSVTWVAT